MNIVAFLRHRARQHWQILLTLSVGVLISTALLATAPMLVNTVVEFSLRRTLLSANPADGNLRLRIDAFISGDPTDYAALDQEIEGLVHAYLGDHIAKIIPAGSSYRLFPWIDNQPLENELISFGFYDTNATADANTIFTDGAWPVADEVLQATKGEDVVVTAVITTDMADAYELAVGDRLPLSLRANSLKPDVWVLVSGIAQPADFRDTYWMGEYSPFRVKSSDGFPAQYAVLIPDSTFWPVTNQIFSPNRPVLAWHILVDPQTISSKAIRPLRTRLTLLKNALDTELGYSTVITTELDDILIDFAQQADAIQAPLLLLTAEMVLLTLYYVVMVASLSVRQVEREFAQLRSRGAGNRHIIRIQLLEAIGIGLVAFVSGPLIGLLLVRGLGEVGPLQDVGQVGWSLNITGVAWLAAGVGALGCVAGLMLPLRSALRRTIVTHQQERIRDDKPVWWQRLYLDVFVLAAGLIFLWRLQQAGGIVGGSASRPQLDWLLLLAPLALLLGAGTILLRIFPLLLRLLAFVAQRSRHFAAPLAMWHISRNPTHVARLVLMLTLSMSLGILTSGLNATLDRSERERALHQVGSDVRFVSEGFIPVSRVQQVPGAADASGLLRLEASVAVERRPRIDLLAIEPTQFAEMSYYRADYAKRPFPELLAHLDTESAEVPVQEISKLPGHPTEVGVWVQAEPPSRAGSPYQGDSNLDRLVVQMKLQTAQNELITLKLTPTETGGYPADGWRYFFAPLDRLHDDAYPISLHSFWIQGRTRLENRYVPVPLRISLDDVTVVDGDSRETAVADSFEDITRVWQIDGNSNSSVQFEGVHSGRAKLTLSLRYARALERLGVRLVNLSNFSALPALASPAFMETAVVELGDEVQVTASGQVLTVRLIGEVIHFPTVLGERDAGFIVVDQKPLLSYLNEFSDKPVNVNEVLLSLAPGADLAQVMAQAATAVPNASRILDAETIRQTIKAAPMALGLRTVTYFGYLVTTFLSLLGFATHFYMSARQRATSYGVLRAIGLSPRQLYTVLTLEQVVLLLSGLAVGTGLGYLLNQLTLADLPITLGGSSPIPPFVPQSGWQGVWQIYLTMVVAFLLTLGLATLLLWRTQLHQVLRIGEE
jgi:ABC-type antimicrobial peptide transport system permease subunit